jgi:hypothetical protein
VDEDDIERLLREIEERGRIARVQRTNCQTGAMKMTADDCLERYGPPSFWFTVPGLNGGRFEGRPISREPEEKTIGFLYSNAGEGKLRQVGPAVFNEGEWKRLSKARAPKPSHWVVMVDVR